MLGDGPHTLRHANRESGWGDTAATMLQVLEPGGAIDRASVELAAAGLSAGDRVVMQAFSIAEDAYARHRAELRGAGR